MRRLIIILMLLVIPLSAQEITWTEQDADLPEGVRLFKGTRTSPDLQAWYLELDRFNDKLAVRPYIGAADQVNDQTAKFGAYAAVNGGFFGGNTSYSTIIYPGEVKAVNVQSLTRNGKSYPVRRAMFSMDSSFNFRADWVYHFDQTLQGVYTFDAPMPYSNNDPDPLPAPQKSEGTLYDEVLLAIGGGPMLVKDGQVNVTYDEEIMWGSGVGLSNRDPRTAVGFGDSTIIMLVADGRQTASEGLSLTELAQVMIDLGCSDAINLDGGGSTQMAIGDSYVNNPSEQRAVPTILAVTHRDSLGLPKEPQVEKIIDTGDEACQLVGDGWFASANAGYWGDTPSQINPKGDGSDYAEFSPGLPAEARYELYGWWVNSFNRCEDTPFIVFHRDGVDTVRVDQTTNGLQWVKIGEYVFSGDSTDKVLISDYAFTNTYIVADAIRFVSYDTTDVTALPGGNPQQPQSLTMHAAYPNPFNPQTSVRLQLDRPATVELDVYDSRGRHISRVASGSFNAGGHTIRINAANWSSGIYFLRLHSAGLTQTQKLLLLR